MFTHPYVFCTNLSNIPVTSSSGISEGETKDFFAVSAGDSKVALRVVGVATEEDLIAVPIEKAFEFWLNRAASNSDQESCILNCIYCVYEKIFYSIWNNKIWLWREGFFFLAVSKDSKIMRNKNCDGERGLHVIDVWCSAYQIQFALSLV